LVEHPDGTMEIIKWADLVNQTISLPKAA